MTTQSVTLTDDDASQAFRDFRDDLVRAGLLFSAGSRGVYGFSAAYQEIVNALDRAITGLGGGAFDPVTFPPVLARSTFDRTNYLASFPDLMGSVHVFRGDDHAHVDLMRRYESDGAWPELLDPADVVLSSAACHVVYPMCSGVLPADGRRFEIANWCFRHEPSDDPARMVAFRMHELVYVGQPDRAHDHRDSMLHSGLELLDGLGLPMDAVPANDPFFGRVGTIMANAQLEQSLKIEGVTPICSAEHPTAIISGNVAGDHFGLPFGITTVDGGVAHSSCVAFGTDRVTLALLRRHGFTAARWPAAVRRRLGM